MFPLFRRSALLCLLITVFTMPPAAAHDVLVGSTPADGAALPAAPEALTLEFNNELLDLGSNAAAVVLTDENSEQIATGPLAIDGREATYRLPQLTDGAYVAAWSVVSSDGHRIQGKIDFTVGSPAPKDAATSSESMAAIERPATATPTALASDNTAEESSTFTGLPRAALIVIALGIVASMVLIILKLRRN